MKMLSLLLLGGCLQLAATGRAQTLTIQVREASLPEVFEKIEAQTSFRFVYTESLLKGCRPVTVNLQQQSLDSVLRRVFANQPLRYELDAPLIILSRRELPLHAPEISKPIPVVKPPLRGRVIDINGDPVVGATVRVKGQDLGTSTDDQGRFEFVDLPPDAVLIITGAELETREFPVSGRATVSIQVTRKENILDETLVIAYGKTSRRLNTGSVTKVTATEIERQPVSNPILAIVGRVPGLMIRTTSGLPSANTAILLRGAQSLRQGTAPFILVDGIPLSTNTERLADVNSNANENLLNLINPADIESIEVLKDAEATSIYGSQGANGVILITTKKGKAGETKVELQHYTGIKRVTRTMESLSTKQYLKMRQEAFDNDQILPDISNAPDLVEWDQNRYTDWKKKMIGGTGVANNIQLSLSGGSAQTQFLASGSWYNEKTVFPMEQPARRYTARINITHQSRNYKLKFNSGVSFARDERNSAIGDPTQYIFLPPNAPAMKGAGGELFWEPGLPNPYAASLRRFEGINSAMIANADIQYQLARRWIVKLSGGYNKTQAQDKSLTPIAAQRPGPTIRGFASYSNGQLDSWLLEPQLHGAWRWGKSNFSVLSGLSFQRRLQERVSIQAREYTNDDFLDNIAAAGQITVRNARSQYRYQALFGRLRWDWDNTWIASFNLRRDGSSRFGPAQQFATFPSLSAGWIFSEAKWVKKQLPMLSFGKLRCSYGITGNDQIGEYQFIDAWGTNNNYNYGFGPGFLPEKLYNPYLQWERTRKIQIGLELGAWSNRYRLTMDFYRNRSDNQLVYYSLPFTTGFARILRNLDALIQNTGWEFTLHANPIRTSYIEWNTLLTLSLPRNRLIRYPNLESSSDAALFEVGQPLGISKRYHWLGIDPTTGLHRFEDIDGDGSIQPQRDYVNVGVIGQHWFGGIESNLHWGKWSFDFFFQFVRQTGYSYLNSLASMPGTLSNQPVSVLDRWQSVDKTGTIQKFSQAGFAATESFNQYLNSSATVVDASFIRLKNLSLSYRMTATALQRLGIQQLRVYVQGQDLLTITRYKGADPETQSVLSLPPLKTLVAGIHLTF